MNRPLGRRQLDALAWFAAGNEAYQNLIRGLRFQREAPSRAVMNSLARRGLVDVTTGIADCSVRINDAGRALITVKVDGSPEN